MWACISNWFCSETDSICSRESMLRAHGLNVNKKDWSFNFQIVLTSISSMDFQQCKNWKTKIEIKDENL